MSGLINVGGYWKNISSILLNVNGYWKEVSSALINDNGYWKQFYNVVSPSFTMPTNFSVQVSSSTSLRTRWNAVTADTGYTVTYDVYRSTSSTAPGTSPTLLYTGLTGNVVNNTGLTSGTTYYYWVRAVETKSGSTTKKSSWAGPVSAKPGAASTYLTSLAVDSGTGSDGTYTATITYTNTNHGDFVLNITTSSGTPVPTQVIASGSTASGTTTVSVTEPGSTSYSSTLTATSEDTAKTANGTWSYTYSPPPPPVLHPTITGISGSNGSAHSGGTDVNYTITDPGTSPNGYAVIINNIQFNVYSKTGTIYQAWGTYDTTTASTVIAAGWLDYAQDPVYPLVYGNTLSNPYYIAPSPPPTPPPPSPSCTAGYVTLETYPGSGTYVTCYRDTDCSISC